MTSAAPRLVRAAGPTTVLLALGLTVLAAGCGGPTPRKAAKARDRATSAATSARLIAAAWDLGAAPGIYASRAVGEMSTSLAAAESSSVWSALPTRQASTIRRELHTLAAVSAGMDTAIRRNDRAAISDLRGSLLDHGGALDGIVIDTTR